MQPITNLTLASVLDVLLPSKMCQWRSPTIVSVVWLHVLNMAVLTAGLGLFFWTWIQRGVLRFLGRYLCWTSAKSLVLVCWTEENVKYVSVSASSSCQDKGSCVPVGARSSILLWRKVLTTLHLLSQLSSGIFYQNPSSKCSLSSSLLQSLLCL